MVKPGGVYVKGLFYQRVPMGYEKFQGCSDSQMSFLLILSASGLIIWFRLASGKEITQKIMFH